MIQSDQQKKTFNNHQTKLIPRKIFPKYNLIAFLNSCNPWRYHNLETWPFSMTLTMDLNILHQVKTNRGLPPSERCLTLRTLGETRSCVEVTQPMTLSDLRWMWGKLLTMTYWVKDKQEFSGFSIYVINPSHNQQHIHLCNQTDSQSIKLYATHDLEDQTTIYPKTLLKTLLKLYYWLNSRLNSTQTLLLTTRRLLLTPPRWPIEAAISNARLNQSVSSRAGMDVWQSCHKNGDFLHLRFE